MKIPGNLGATTYKNTYDWDLGYKFERNEIIREWDPKPVWEKTEIKFFHVILNKNHQKSGLKLKNLGIRIKMLNINYLLIKL